MIKFELAILGMAIPVVEIWIMAILQSVINKKKDRITTLMKEEIDVLSYMANRAVEELTSENGIVNGVKKERLFNSLMFEAMFGSHSKNDES